ncbi:hypothetical protein NDU88_007820 [Pleurodeles waltl]|uniref:WW domain-containing protein n=1 Tax=Pleurodeles waltl TaxID=8319 RepID=A0AAV7NXF7_PLEWA|nr:hypothetical protein NDU88_007820 [Pleurodeles waltl]
MVRAGDWGPGAGGRVYPCVATGHSTWRPPATRVVSKVPLPGQQNEWAPRSCSQTVRDPPSFLWLSVRSGRHSPEIPESARSFLGEVAWVLGAPWVSFRRAVADVEAQNSRPLLCAGLAEEVCELREEEDTARTHDSMMRYVRPG